MSGNHSKFTDRKTVKVGFAGIVGALALGAVATPAFAIGSINGADALALDEKPPIHQTLVAADYADPAPSALSEVKVEIDPVAQAKYEADLAAKKAAEAKAKADAEAAAAAREQAEAAPQQAEPQNQRPRVNFEISGEGRPDIVAAAVAQVGVFQDCTDLVQNSLAAGGINATRAAGGWDFGTAVSEYTRFGGRIVTDGYLPGDVLIWENQHVAIYAGKGKIVHGGWNGNQTVINDVFSPNASPTVVRF